MGNGYTKGAPRTLAEAQTSMFLSTNGLGGYASLTGAFSVTRCDHGILNAAVRAPDLRVTMVHRLRETLCTEEGERFLSTQAFGDGSAPEDGYRCLEDFTYDGEARWTYRASGVRVSRRCAMGWEKNTTVLLYTVENHGEAPCTLCLEPVLKPGLKEEALDTRRELTMEGGTIRFGDLRLYIHTSARIEEQPVRWEVLAYPEDAKDGRPEKGLAASCCKIRLTVPPGERKDLELIFSTEAETPSGEELLSEQRRRRAALAESCGLADETGRRLALASDAFVVRRDSTGGKTIVAGYPLFSDWGRDTMIALEGCCLVPGRYEDARSILETFLRYERNGLVPNLFPEGGRAPMYNTVDAALLLIDGVWKYLQRTGDWDFVRQAWPVMERILRAYREGTDHGIGMDEDGLISAGSGLDQLTWMDVCVEGILPTPRHGKPVEVNAYWYNALRIMERLGEHLGLDTGDYGALADRVRDAFRRKFYMEDKGCLRDVLSGTRADQQLRCNQIWAVTMPFTMLTPEQERRVVDTVEKHLYTPRGLRTLLPEDPDFKPFYGGPQLQRDLAYHQGTVWVYPLGAYYLAYLKTHGSTREAVRYVRDGLRALEPMLCEGCVGQLPEIYDGGTPGEGKGCFAQAWSVGELLRVFEAVEKSEKGE